VSDAGLPVASSDAALESFRAQCSETELYTDYTVMRWKPRKIGG
jgi:hypothetical protein